MGLSAVDPFVGLAGGANIAFESLDEPETQPFLFFTGTGANGTRQTLLSELPVFVGDLSGFHIAHLIRTRKANRLAAPPLTTDSTAGGTRCGVLAARPVTNEVHLGRVRGWVLCRVRDQALLAPGLVGRPAARPAGRHAGGLDRAVAFLRNQEKVSGRARLPR